MGTYPHNKLVGLLFFVCFFLNAFCSFFFFFFFFFRCFSDHLPLFQLVLKRAKFVPNGLKRLLFPNYCKNRPAARHFAPRPNGNCGWPCCLRCVSFETSSKKLDIPHVDLITHCICSQDLLFFDTFRRL